MDSLETMETFLKNSQKPLKMGLKRMKIMKRFLIKKKKPLKIRFKSAGTRVFRAPSSRYRRGRRDSNFDSPPVGFPISEDDQHIDSSTSVYGFPEGSYHSVIGFPSVDQEHEHSTKSWSNSPHDEADQPTDNNTSYEDAAANASFSTIHESDGTGTTDNSFPEMARDPEEVVLFPELIDDLNLVAKESGSASDDNSVIWDKDWEAFVNGLIYAIFVYENVCIRGIDL
ncbi:hypothetical protein ACOSQ4_004264 [Xanthoceras sorbifolium]